MNTIELKFDNPWLLLLIIPCLAVILVPFFLLPAKRRKSFKKIAPAVIHSVVVVMLVLILSGFSFVKKTSDRAVLLLADLSDSTADVSESIVAHTEELLELIDKDTPVGVILFGKSRLYAAKLDENSRTFKVEEITASATNIEEALEYAATLLPTDKSGQIIILSDGKETDGDAASAAHYLATRGVRIDAVYFDTTNIGTAEMQIASINAPDGAYKDDTVSFEIEIKSNVEAPALLKLYDGDALAGSASVTVTEGSSIYLIDTVAGSAGIHSYRVELETSSDTIEKNNSSYAFLKVSGEPSILVISDTLLHGNTLAQLISEGNSVTVVTAQNAPSSILELCNYDEVILSNVDYGDLPRNYDKLLDTYVGVYGRSLLVSGGTGTLMYGSMEGTAIEEMLPVTLSVTESSEGSEVALMLVLDCSMSMSNNSTYLSVAKQGAIKCVEALSDNDYVGVVSFNRSAYLKSELIKATSANKQSVTRIISGLATSQGTYYTEALKLACEQLKKSDAPVKHIIFLSDGQPSDSGYSTVAKQAAAEGITISTIGLGYSSSILSSLADAAGGRYYYVTRATELPDIMLSETEQVTASSLITGEFIPQISKESELTAYLGDASLPAITGYLGTTAKEDATVYLTAGENEHPVYAEWKYGTGTVGVFTTDLYGNWSAKLMTEENGKALISNLISTTIDDVHHDSSLETEITVRGSSADITVATAGTNTENVVSVTVAYEGGSQSYILSETTPGIYEGSIHTGDSGTYQVMILETDTGNNIVDFLETAFSVSYSAEYDAFAESGETLLGEIVSYSGGALFTDMSALAAVEAVSIELLYNPMLPFAVICLILMLADIAIRKIRWKDIRAYFLKLKNTGSRA